MTDTYTPDLTTVPTRTIPAPGSTGNHGIGPTKINGAPTVDYVLQLDAAEENYLRDACRYLMLWFGCLRSGETLDDDPETARDRLDALEETASSGTRYRFLDHFVSSSWLHEWTTIGAPTATTSTARGWSWFPLTGQNGVRFGATHFCPNFRPVIECRVWADTIGAGCGWQFGFYDGAGLKGWWVEYDPDKDPNIRLKLMCTAGTYYVDTGVAADTDAHTIRMAVTGDSGSHTIEVYVDDAPVVSYDTQQPDVALAMPVLVTLGAAGGGGLAVDWIDVTADFTRDAPGE